MGIKNSLLNIQQKGGALVEAVQSVVSLENRHGATYDAMRAVAGVPLDQVTDEQVLEYMGLQAMSAEAMAEVKTCLAMLEATFSTVRPFIATLPPNDVG